MVQPDAMVERDVCELMRRSEVGSMGRSKKNVVGADASGEGGETLVRTHKEK